MNFALTLLLRCLQMGTSSGSNLPHQMLPPRQQLQTDPHIFHKRCINTSCQNQLPADDCPCEICANRKGFCNLCMCVICSKFDFQVNTCRWIGCDVCSHWAHTDCAIREGEISKEEMLFKCRACNRTSELLGWVRDVFQHCAPNWDREGLMKELDFVSRIFRGGEDTRGKKLVCKCEELINKIKGGLAEATAAKLLLMFFQGKPTRLSSI